MTSVLADQVGAQPPGRDAVAAARGLREVLRELRPIGDQQRRLTDDAVAALRAAGQLRTRSRASSAVPSSGSARFWRAPPSWPTAIRRPAGSS